jgi:hypothetical protein
MDRQALRDHLIAARGGFASAQAFQRLLRDLDQSNNA